MGRGEGDAQDCGSMNWYGGDKKGVYYQKRGSSGAGELKADAREMR